MGEIVRLQKYIAMCGIASRRSAEQLIADGSVKVNGEKVTEQGVKVEIGADKVSVNGKIVKPSGKNYYIMLNKPVGYVTTMSDEKGRKTVRELVEDVGVRVYPVGRLDINSEGLLIMTNDGDFANGIMHPSFEKKKTRIL